MKLVANVKGKAFEIEWDDLEEHVQKHIIEYGFQRKINDHANKGGKDASDDQRHGLAQQKIDDLKNGVIQVVRAASGLDELGTEVLRMLKQSLAKQGNKELLKAIREDKDKARELVEKYKDQLKEAAQIRIDERKKQASALDKIEIEF